MNKRITFIILLIFIFVFGYLYYTKFPNNYFEGLVSKPSVAKYFGTLPCADCPGINEEITFVQSKNNPPSGTYTISDVYQERNNNQPITAIGTWVETGEILELTEENKSSTTPQKSYYLKLNETQIVQLDSDKNKINTPSNMTLTLVK